MKASIEQKNTELMLEKIRRDTREAADNLAVVLKQSQEELDDIRTNGKEELEQIAKARNDLQVKKLEIEEAATRHDAAKTDRVREIADLEKKIDDARRLLQKINGHIFAANDEYDQKQGTLRDINKDIEDARKLAEKLLEVKNEYAAQEERRRSITLENILAIENAKSELNKIHLEREGEEKRRDEAKTVAEEEESKRQRAIKEAARIQQACDIHVRRVETHYKEAFPHLRVRILDHK